MTVINYYYWPMQKMDDNFGFKRIKAMAKHKTQATPHLKGRCESTFSYNFSIFSFYSIRGAIKSS